MGQIGSEPILTIPLSNNYLIRSSLIKYGYILGIGVMLQGSTCDIFSLLFETGLIMELWLTQIYVDQAILRLPWACCLGLLSVRIIAICLNALLV